MPQFELKELLEQNSYPGRGIVLGRTEDGSKAVIAYFIMGRSENSRNRVFVEDGEGIRTQAFDPSKMKDPSLIIYAPVRLLEKATIVANGDQSDTIYDFMAQGKTFEDALRTRTFEPDGPIYTPRISGIVMANGDYRLSILKTADGNPASDCRYFFEYTNSLVGQGHFIHTYRCDGDPVPSFEGEPKTIAIRGNIDEFTAEVWNSLNSDNKVSLFTRFIDLASGKYESRIINKNS